jgi:hypothetical protein
MSYTPVITITGKIQDFLGNNAVGATVSVRLTNFGLDNPRVPGSCIISSPKIPVAQDGLGGFSFTPIGNDVITPPNTFYLVTFTSDNANTASLTIPYQFTGTGTQDLSQIIPFNQGGIGGPQISNIVVKNPTALQTIASFGLSVPQIQDLTAPLLPHTAGGTDIGSALLPFSNVYVGSSATNNIKVTGTASAARVFTLPDANSNPIQPVSGSTAHQWVSWIDSNGVQHLSQPDYSDLTGKPQLAQTIASASHKWLVSYDASTGLFTATQPDYSDLTGRPQLANTFGVVSHEFLTAYDATTGNLTAAQPSFSDISGVAVSGQIPNLDASKITTGTFATAQIPNLDASKITTGQIALARGGTAADLSATGGTHQVLKQSSTGAAITVGQLAFSDISGTLAATQLPNPSASTLGGVESAAAVTHQWIDSISTSGVPHLSQPAYSDISGTPTLPANTTAVSHKYLTAYNSTTGAFTQAQPSVADLSDGSVGTGTVVLSSGAVINSATLGLPTIGSGGASFAGSSSGFTTLQPAATASGTITIPGATDQLVARATTDTLTHKTIDTAGTGNHIQLGGVDLPASIGTNGQVLTNSSGVLAFTTVSGGGGSTPGGATNSIQYNNGSSFSGSMCLTPAGTIAPNAAFISSIKTFSATGNSDLYTCPANKRAIITEMTVFNGHATNSSTLVAMLKIGGVYYPASASTTILAQSTGSRSVTYVLEAGEILALNMTQQPFNVVVSIMEFDNTSNIKSAKLTTSTLTSGDNTVYTVPNGKSALILNNTLTMCSGTQGTFTAGNNSGGNVTYKWNVVPSGGSVGTTNQMSASVVVSTGAGSSQTLTGFTIGAGDFISVNASSGTSDQIAFVTVVEI